MTFHHVPFCISHKPLSPQYSVHLPSAVASLPPGISSGCGSDRQAATGRATGRVCAVRLTCVASSSACACAHTLPATAKLWCGRNLFPCARACVLLLLFCANHAASSWPRSAINPSSARPGYPIEYQDRIFPGPSWSWPSYGRQPQSPNLLARYAEAFGGSMG